MLSRGQGGDQGDRDESQGEEGVLSDGSLGSIRVIVRRCTTS